MVGGGLSGLFTASELVNSGVDDVTVVEASIEPGGISRTIERDGFALEPGAGSFNLPSPHLGPIISRGGARVEPARGSRVRHLYVEGRLVGMTSSPAALLAPVLPWPAKLRALGEMLIGPDEPENDESLDGFCRRRFGDRAGGLLAWLMAAGVYAGDPQRLSAAAAFPMMTALEREHGSVIRGALQARRNRSTDSELPGVHVPAGGMAALADSLASPLGDRLLVRFPVESITREGSRWIVHGPETLEAERVVVAVRPEIAAGLIGGDLADILTRGVAAPVAVIGVGGTGDSPLPDGFGALVGPGEGLVTLGILFESSYAPARAPEGSWLMKVIAGGATRPEVAGWDDETLFEVVTQEAAQVLGRSLAPGFVEVVRHHPGIPQYQWGHRNWLTGVDSLLERLPGLHLTGWGYRGVGVAALATDAVRVVREVAG